MVLIFSNIFAQGGGNALMFDGDNDYVESMNTIGIVGNTPRTISAWVKSAQLYSASCCPTPFSWGFPSVGMGFGNFIASGIWWFWGYQNDIGTGVGVDLEWNHHSITYDGSMVIYYLNGNIIASQSKNLNTAPSRFFVGDGFDHRSDTPFNGIVDEVRVWKKVFTQEEIKERIFRKLRQSEIGDTNLVLYYRFNEGSGSMTVDSSVSNNHGSLINMDTTNAWVSSSIPLASDITDTLTNITAIWAAADSNASSILSVRDSTISGDDAVIFGHNSGGLSFDPTDVPVNLGILQRLSRVWRLEVYGVLKGDLIIDVKDLNIINGSALRLLVDSDGVFADADTVNGVYNEMDSVFVVSAHNLQHGYYYTLGTQESPTAIKWKPDRYLPDIPQLFQNYPNPFNPATHITFQISKPGDVQLTIFTLWGGKVKTLVSKKLSVGTYQIQWDGRNEQGVQVASGIYFYRLNIGSYSEVRKMILLR